MEPFTERVVRIVSSIPPGKVLSYGIVAALAGNPRAARQVARLLHSLSGKFGLPWQRVVNREGKISLPGEAGLLQRKLLEAEGVRFAEAGRIGAGGGSVPPPFDQTPRPSRARSACRRPPGAPAR